MEKEIVMGEDQLKSLLENTAKAAADETLRKATPELFQTSESVKVGRNRAEKVEQLKHLSQVFKAAANRDADKLEKLRQENPQYYSVEKANWNEGTSAQGGYVVPTFWYDQVFANVEQYGFARKLAKLFPMQSNKTYLNSAGSVSVSWTAEGSAPTLGDSSSFFTQTTLTAQRLAGAFVASRQLIDDANVAYMDYMSNELARAIAEAEDEAFFNGNGSGATPTGLVGTSGVNVSYLGGSSSSGKTTRAGWSWKDLMRARTTLKSSFMANAVYVIPQTAYGYLLQEQATTNQPMGALTTMFQPIEANDPGIAAIGPNGTMPATGKKLYVVPDSCFPSDAVTTCTGIFGDFSRYGILGVRTEAEVNTYNQYYGSTALAGTNQIAVEMAERIGVAFPVAAAFTLIKTSTT